MEKNKKQIRVQVRDKVAELVDKGQFIVGGNDDYEVVFDFDEAWDDYPAKTALFVYGETVVEKVIIGNVCEGVSVEGASVVGIGVYSGDQSTTTPAFLNCKQSIRDLAKYKTPVAPSEDVYAQIIALLNQYIAEVNNIVAKAVEDYLVANPPEAAFSPIVSVSPIENGHRVTITDINESHTFDVMNGAKGERGEKGEQGIQGEAGYTPQRGVDYWTPDDVAMIEGYVDGSVAREVSAKVEPQLRNHEIRISNIEQHISNDYFVTDDSVAYEKAVPARACSAAKLLSLGGMTYKCNNILPYPYVETTHTENGITFTDNGDGTFTANGTAIGGMAGLRIYYKAKNEIFEVGKTYSISDGTSNPIITGYYTYISATVDGTATTILGTHTTATRTYTCASTPSNISVNFVIKEGVTVNNLLIKPMLNEGSTALPYEPYYEGLRDSKVGEIVSRDTEGNAIATYPIPAEIQAIEGYGKDGFNIDLVAQESDYNGNVKPLPVPLDSIIKVEGGGSLEFVNEYKNPVPSAVKYLLKEESAV